ncbi:MAG: hypothetical protein JXB14_04625 [Candidatus Altiarchaeota archaeon]|nr:hypothetical protein [Candidatus Altiarchaeota archaeon]
MKVEFGWARNPKDYREIWEVWNTRFEPKDTYVARVDGKVVGYAWFEGEKLTRIAMLADRRNPEISNALLEKALSAHFNRNPHMKEIMLTASADNFRRQRALERWYQMRGGEQIPTKQGFVHSGDFRFTREKFVKARKRKSRPK